MRLTTISLYSSTTVNPKVIPITTFHFGSACSSGANGGVLVSPAF